MRKTTVDLNENLDLAADVSPREEDEGYEEVSSKTTDAVLAIQCAGPVTRKVRHGQVEGAVHRFGR